MTASRLEVFNRALYLLGQDPILDVNVDEDVPNKIREIENTARKALLQSVDYDFAREEATLALISSNVTEGLYTRKFALPSDYLEIRLVYTTESDYQGGRQAIPVAYEIRQGYLYTDFESPQIRYTKDITDYSKFDPLFIETLASKMAATVSPQVYQSDSKTDYLHSRTGTNQLISGSRAVGRNQKFYRQNSGWLQHRYYRTGINRK